MNFSRDGCWEEDFDLFRRYRNKQYQDAYGDYRGGYGPPRGPPPFFGPPPLLDEQYDFPPPFPDMMGPPGPPGPRGPPMFRRRPFRGGPPPPKTMDDRALKFLLRCGMPVNIIRSLPNEMLHLMEPDHCGLCAQNFESFNIARVHYLSKNHQKNQKKWISQKVDLRKLNAKEAPIKARELYCELCDVQITSKQHADSHYAGKSHLAIVEGRKNPKNPVLLQPGMERRTHQLIRREKKFRNMKKAADGGDEVVASPAPKPIQPDLYCEICKSAVSCSEQMTSHLNGKRHLNKEKAYILKKMRGEDTGDVPKMIIGDREAGGAEKPAADEKKSNGGNVGDGKPEATKVEDENLDDEILEDEILGDEVLEDENPGDNKKDAINEETWEDW